MYDPYVLVTYCKNAIGMAPYACKGAVYDPYLLVRFRTDAIGRGRTGHIWILYTGRMHSTDRIQALYGSYVSAVRSSTGRIRIPYELYNVQVSRVVSTSQL